MKRTVLFRAGRRGDQVKVVRDVGERALVTHYRDADGRPKKKHDPDTRAGKAEAIAWAESFHARRDAESRAAAAPERLTVREIWEAYRNEMFTGGTLRPATRISYEEKWNRWELHLGKERIAETVTLRDVGSFKSAAVAAGYALNQVRQTLAVARIVFNWAQRSRLLVQNDLALHRWQQPKDEAPLAPAEYSADEFQRLLRAFDPSTFHGWRPWVFLMLAGHAGQRARAVLHLRWADVDLERGVLTWPGKYQKQGKPLERPIGWAMFSALLVAQARRVAESPWVLPAARRNDAPYSYTSMHTQLTRAEQRAGVPHLPYRAAHGFRRMVVGDIGESTGDRVLGLEYVGDTDVKQLKSYDRRQAERVARAAAAMEERPKEERNPSAGRPETEPAPSGVNGEL